MFIEHMYLNTDGIFEVTDVDSSAYGSNIEYLVVVAGGGGGGTNLGGGGGAGGLRTNVPGLQIQCLKDITAPAYPVSNGQYTVVQVVMVVLDQHQMVVKLVKLVVIQNFIQHHGELSINC